MATKKTNKPPQSDLALPPAGGSTLVDLKIKRPEEPLLASAEKLLARAKQFTIASADDYRDAADIRAQIRAEHDAMEARHKKMKKPVLDAGKEVDQLFKPAIATLDQAIETISSLMSSYDAEQRKIAEGKQRAAEEEARRTREEAQRLAAEERKRTEMAMQEIQAINQQVMIASMGRAGVRKGGTLECIRETLVETEQWPVTATILGNMFEAAVKAKQTAIQAIKALEAQILAKQEQARIAAEQAAAKAAGDAERIKKAEAEAAAERTKALEARKAQLRAEQEAQKARQDAAEAAEASSAKAEVLEQRAANAVAPKIEADIVRVPGLSRPKTWQWRLLDKSKIKQEFLIVDEKSINKLVVAAHERAVDMVGAGSIEVYQEETLRQDR